MLPRKTTALLTALAALLFTSPALAHSDLVSSDPGDGATVSQPLEQIELVFSSSLELGFSVFKLYPLQVDTTHTTPAADTEAGHDGEEAGHEHAADEDAHGDEHAGEDAHGDEHAGEDAHGDEHGAEAGSVHALMDAAAEALVAEVLALEDDAGARVPLTITPATGTGDRVLLTPEAELPPGAYVVMWQVLSLDSHTIQGFLTFDYDPEAGD